MTLSWTKFSDKDKLAAELASFVAQQLTAAIKNNGQALLAISGGSTPKTFLQSLSNHPIEWDKVMITLVDERCVPESSSRSNAALARENLLINTASAAHFIPLYKDGQSIASATECANQAIAALPLPFDVIVLGMGNDGHTASLFPDAENIETLLTQNNGPDVIPVQSVTAQEPRLTLSLPVICSSSTLILHIEGDEKAAVLNQALLSETCNMPIRTVLERARNPVKVYWAPTKGN